MTTLAQVKYGYDRSGNRLYRRDELGHSASFDELYGYDGLNRLTSFHRGELNNGNNALVGDPTLGQGWTLDPGAKKGTFYFYNERTPSPPA